MGSIYVTHKSENGKKQTNDLRINEAFIINILRQKKLISSENTSQGVCKSDHVSSENIFHNKPSYNLNYNSKDPYTIKNLSKDLTPKEFKSFSKYKKKRLMNESEVNDKVHDWLMKGELTDFDVN